MGVYAAGIGRNCHRKIYSVARWVLSQRFWSRVGRSDWGNANPARPRQHQTRKLPGLRWVSLLAISSEENQSQRQRTRVSAPHGSPSSSGKIPRGSVPWNPTLAHKTR